MNWIEMLNSIICNKTLNSYEKLAYIVLLKYSNKEGVSFPSYTTISSNMACSRPTAVKAIDGLIKQGIVKKNMQRGSNNNHRNIYTIPVIKNMRANPNLKNKKVRGKVVKNKFHNFTETYTNYSEHEFDEMINKLQKSKWG